MTLNKQHRAFLGLAVAWCQSYWGNWTLLELILLQFENIFGRLLLLITTVYLVNGFNKIYESNKPISKIVSMPPSFEYQTNVKCF